MSIEEDVHNECECGHRFRNRDTTQHLTGVDIEQVVRTGGTVNEVLCDNLDYNPF